MKMIFNVSVVLFWSIANLAIPVLAHAGDVMVVDGDTLEISGVKHRLHGIDTPEPAQKCNTAKGGVWACGKAATEAMNKLVGDKTVKCDNRGLDSLNRIIGVCTADGIELNEALVSKGLAWAFTTYSNDYVEIEKKAREKNLGIWQAPNQTAEDFRKDRWKVAEQDAPNGCPIKGNISKRGRIYHAPWSPWYDRTKVSVEKGERWFCTELAAQQAGWRAPYWGR